MGGLGGEDVNASVMGGMEWSLDRSSGSETRLWKYLKVVIVKLVQMEVLSSTGDVVATDCE